MPDDTMLPETSTEPTPTPVEPQSAPVVDPVATQAPTEPVPSGTPDSTAPTMPSVAPEAPTGTVTPDLGQTSVSSPEPENPPSAPVSAPVEPSSSFTPTPTPPADPAPAPQPTPVATATAPNPRSFLAKALSVIQFRKRAKLEKIIKLATEKKSITNDNVEKLLHVSDATASRYLLQLVKEGKLKKVGPDGRARYEPVSGSLPTN